MHIALDGPFAHLLYVYATAKQNLEVNVSIALKSNYYFTRVHYTKQLVESELSTFCHDTKFLAKHFANRMHLPTYVCVHNMYIIIHLAPAPMETKLSEA